MSAAARIERKRMCLRRASQHRRGRVGALVQRSYRGASDTLLPPAATRLMMTRQRVTNEAPGQFIGLGVFLGGTGPNACFQHAGGTPGHRCHLHADLERPLAIAIMTNPEVGDRILGLVLEAIRAA